MMLSMLSIFDLGLSSSAFPGNTFQNLSVSSPAPVTMVVPSGLMARQRTRQVCPVRVARRCMSGYFQMLISFWEQPWVLTSSFTDLLNIRLQTCEPTSQEFRVVPVRVLRTLIVRSAVPPPETSRPCWWGDQAMAFTAARWSVNLTTGYEKWAFQMRSRLSLPPEQSCCSSKDHFNPQISCLWPESLPTKGELARRSRCRMVLSLEPVDSREVLQLIAPTLRLCPVRVAVNFTFSTSQICTSPLLVPKASKGAFPEHATEVAMFCMPKSHSLVTLELEAFQRYTLVARPTARQFWGDQSMRLRQKSSCNAGASSTLTGSLPIFLPMFLKLDSFCPISPGMVFSLVRYSFSVPGPCSPYLRRLQFSKLSILVELRTGEVQSSMTQRRYRSGSRSSLGGSWTGERAATSFTERQSGRRSLRLGMKRSTWSLRQNCFSREVEETEERQQGETGSA